MAVPPKIIKFLDKAKVKYELIKHRTVFTAQDKAATLKVPPKMVGKTLVIKFNGNYGLVLIPANRNLDKGKFKKIVNNWRKKIGQRSVKTIDFVSEAWMKKNLKGVKIGATPPFGNLWKLSTFIDRLLLKIPKIFINSGDYNWSIKVSKASLKKLIPDFVAGNFGKAK